ncbi:MAG: MFS transporter [Pseudomonadota bacterium]
MTATRFPQFSLFAGMLAFAGLPLYIHAPKFFADKYGLSLSLLGGALLAVRALDFIQDPALGWVADKLRGWQAPAAVIAALTMAIGMVALFAVPAVIAPIWWFVLCLAVLFTAYSFLSILFYAQGVATATRHGTGGHVTLAAWREGGALLGICLAAVLPTLLQGFGISEPLSYFAFIFAALAMLAAAAMYFDWTGVESEPTPVFDALRDRGIRRLMVLGVLNAAPVAVSSTLFLFFVGDRLGSDEAAGPLLLFFFLAAAASVPVWAKLSERIGMKQTLLWGMALSIAAFGWAVLIGEGDIFVFAIICVLSGAALGADMTFLPALFARRIEVINMPPGLGFGLWNFCAKLSLALAAATVLPALDGFGFETGQQNTDQALWGLTLLYAGLPCLLKIGAFAFLARTDLGDPT